MVEKEKIPKLTITQLAIIFGIAAYTLPITQKIDYPYLNRQSGFLSAFAGEFHNRSLPCQIKIISLLGLDEWADGSMLANLDQLRSGRHSMAQETVVWCGWLVYRGLYYNAVL